MKLRPVIRTLRKLAPLIENTINYSNLTNGPIEGINNKIKLIKEFHLVIEIMIICAIESLLVQDYSLQYIKILSNLKLLNIYL